MTFALTVAFLWSLPDLPGIVSIVLFPLAVLGAPLAAAELIVIALVLRRFRMAASIVIAFLPPVTLWQAINNTARVED